MFRTQAAVQQIRATLSDIATKYAGNGVPKPEWTAEIKKRISAMGRAHDLTTCGIRCDDREWLFDLVWLRNTKRKLAQLQKHYEASRNQLATNRELRAMSLRSVRRLINQLKEEIALFESRAVR